MIRHPILFGLSGTMTQHTSGLCNGYFTKKESDGAESDDQASKIADINTFEMVWDESDRRVKDKQPTSAQHMWELLQDFWESIPGEAG